MFPFICDLTIKATILLLVATTVSLTLHKSSAAAKTPITLARGIVIAPLAVDGMTNRPSTSALFALSNGYPASL